MAEETAGIGEAGALVNRATAPQDMAITKGIIQSQNNALRKAQVEARKLAAIDAMKEKQSKYLSQVGIGKYENQIVQDESNADSVKTMAELATVSGNPKEEYRVINEYTQRERNRGIKDNSISVLNPTKNKGYITFDDAYNIAKKNPQELQTWANSRHFLEKKHLLNPSSGEFVAPVIPKKNLALVFEKAKDDLNYAFKDIASKGRGMNVITSEIPIEAIKSKAISLLTGDVDVYDNLDFNKDFKKYFDDNVKVVVDMAMKENSMLNREEVETEIQNKLEPEIKTNYVTQEIQNLAKPKTQMGRSFDFQAAQQKTTNEITTNITNKTNGVYTFTPDANGEIVIGTKDKNMPSKSFDNESGTTFIPKRILKDNGNDTFDVLVKIDKVGRAELNTSINAKDEGQEMILKVSKADLQAAFNLQDERYYKGLVLDQLKAKAKKATGATGAKGAKGKKISKDEYRKMTVPQRTEFKNKGGIVE
jgi:hypothetical protein